MGILPLAPLRSPSPAGLAPLQRKSPLERGELDIGELAQSITEAGDSMPASSAAGPAASAVGPSLPSEDIGPGKFARLSTFK